MGLTLQLSALAIVLGLLVGIVGALCRTSGNRYVSLLAAAYVEAQLDCGANYLNGK